MGNNPEIVGNHQVSELSLLLQFCQQIEDLRLHRHIQRRRRLIQQQYLRLKNQRSGYRHALPLPAGELNVCHYFTPASRLKVLTRSSTEEDESRPSMTLSFTAKVGVPFTPIFTACS